MRRGAIRGATSGRKVKPTSREPRHAASHRPNDLFRNRNQNRRLSSSSIPDIEEHELPQLQTAQNFWYQRDMRVASGTPMRNAGQVTGSQKGQDTSNKANKRGREEEMTTISKGSRATKLRKEGTVTPWDFDVCIRRLFSKVSKSRSRSVHVRWEPVSKEVADSIMLIIRGNMRAAMSKVFGESADELKSKLKLDDATPWASEEERKKEIRRMLHGKRKLMEEIVDKIENKLLESKLPHGVSGENFDVESIVRKREFIQVQYKQLRREAERLELELQREKAKLDEAKRFVRSLRETKRRTVNESSSFGDELQPVLHRAMQNDHDRIDKGETAPENGGSKLYQRDLVKFNLLTHKTVKTFGDRPDHKVFDENTLLELLPSLRDYSTVNQNLYKSTSSLLRGNTDALDDTDI